MTDETAPALPPVDIEMIDTKQILGMIPHRYPFNG